MKDKIIKHLEKYGKKIGLDLPYFVKGGFWMTVKQSLGGISGLALAMAFARLSTKDVYGQYQLIFSIFSIISLIAIPGLNVAVARSVARGNDGDYKKSVRTSFTWSLLGIPIILIVGGYYFIYVNRIIGITLFISSIIFPLFYAPNTWGGFLLGKSRFDIYMKYGSIQALFNSLATVSIVVFCRNSLIPIILVSLGSTALSNVIFYYLSLRLVENNNEDKETVGYGWFLTFTYNIESLADSLNKLIIGIFLSPAYLAIFNIVSLLAVKLGKILKPIFNVVFPKMASDKVKLENIFLNNKKLLFLALLFLFFVGGLYYLLIDKVNLILFGESYKNYYLYSKYLFPLVVLYLPVVLLTKYAHAKKKNKTIMYSGPVFFIVRILVSVVLIYMMGLKGAVLALDVNIALQFFILLFFLRQKENMPDY